jgi:CubicO group peptidase (beta-lactamase class C family)
MDISRVLGTFDGVRAKYHSLFPMAYFSIWTQRSVAGVFFAFALAHFGLTAGLPKEIDQLARQYVQSGQVPGIIIGVWRPGSGLSLINYGVSDLASGAPMNRANAQRIASITKSFTVTRILQLADEGRLGLDDPIDKYVPNIHNGSATLRELADMTSGIFNYTEDATFIRKFASHLTEPVTTREIVAAANSHEPYFAPGGRWYYSNTNTVLLGMVVERVTGRPLRVELTREIIRPLGLAHTLYPTSVFLPKPFSRGYAVLDTDQGRIDVTEITPTATAGSGALVSTLDDLRLWGRALARGSLLSRRSQLARLQTIDSSKGVGPYYDRYGLGIGRISGWLGHTGDVLGFQSLVMHNLVADETVVIFVNSSNPDHIPTVLFRRIVALLSPALPAQPTATRISGKRHRATSGISLRIRGRAFSEAGILLVEYSGNGGPYRLARGTSVWRLRPQLQPGRNVISIRSIDRLGRKSKVSKIIVTRS